MARKEFKIDKVLKELLEEIGKAFIETVEELSGVKKNE